MLVKEVKQKIKVYRRNYDNLIKLQEILVGRKPLKEHSSEDFVKARTLMQDEAELEMPLRDLCSSTSRILLNEIERMEKAIDNAVVELE